MQQQEAVTLQTILPDHAYIAIIRFCFFFNSIRAIVIDVSELDEMEKDIVMTLYLLEKCFPHSFFNKIVHLTVNLVHEVRLSGPVYLRWMYPFKRNMKTIKGYVHNHYRSERYIAEFYIAEEALEFCAGYLLNMQTIGNSPRYVKNSSIQMAIGGGKSVLVEYKLLSRAHLYVLQNTEEVQPLIWYL